MEERKFQVFTLLQKSSKFYYISIFLFTAIIWTSTLTEKGRADKYLDPNKYIIQVWTTGEDPLIAELLQKKFKVINEFN